VTTAPKTLEALFDLLLTVFTWSALVLGIVVSATGDESVTRVAVAAAVAGAFAIALQATPRHIRNEPPIGDLLTIAGIGCALTAVALTGGVDSGYLLYTVVPTFFASSQLGYRTGLAAGLLAVVGLFITAAALDQSVADGSVWLAAGLHLVVAVGFSQALRIYGAQEARAAALAAERDPEAERVARLDAAHDLLIRLSELAEGSELNPVSVGNDALDSLHSLMKFDSAAVAIAGNEGPVVVARRGDGYLSDGREEFPLTVGDRNVGFVTMTRAYPYDDEERTAVRSALRPVALSFSNVLLLRDIAKRAVRGERVRLARELHDEIGPSLASLGLALDLALLQYPTKPELGSHLQQLRGSVEGLVEEVRRTVTDLRQDAGDSLLQRATALGGEFQDNAPRLVVELEERRPPRPSQADELGAILTEAVRNARLHAGATAVTVSGFVDHDRGELVVSDDGAGFDPETVADRRFGLIGMAERAAGIGGRMDVATAPGQGTTITVRWGAA
jgi:signal transduction histidine kinase